MMKSRLKPALLAAAIGFGGMAVAQAAPVAQWGYQVDGAWDSAAFTGGPGSANSGIYGDVLRWGVPNTSGGQQSSLAIGNNPAIGVATTGTTGDPLLLNFAPALSLTHTNNVLQGGSNTLTSAVLQATLTLTPLPAVDYGGLVMPPMTIKYNIQFTETTNATPCAAPSPAGNPCNDIFVQVDGAMNDSFTFGEYKYFVNILALGSNGQELGTLSNAACAAAGAANGCIGFTTIENQANTLQFGFTITTTPVVIDVPAPGVLALLGLGLGAIGVASRRRKAA